MTAAGGPWLSPAETCARLGLTVKALRLYERHGLVSPLRSAAGWRAYGPDQIARLHQVLALKALGLPLRRIGALLEGHALAEVLALQECALGAEHQRVGKALALVRAARAKLAGGGALSLDDLAGLARETTQPGKPSPAELEAIFAPLIERHYSAAERAALAARPFDPDEAAAAWEALIAEAEALMAAGDPASPAARDLARRWQAQLAQFSGGDPVLSAKAGAVWKEALADPAAAPKLPLTPALMDFMAKAVAAVKADA